MQIKRQQAHVELFEHNWLDGVSEALPQARANKEFQELKVLPESADENYLTTGLRVKWGVQKAWENLKEFSTIAAKLGGFVSIVQTLIETISISKMREEQPSAE